MLRNLSICLMALALVSVGCGPKGTSADFEQAVLACISAGPNREEIASFAQTNMLASWNDQDQKDFLEKIESDARSLSDDHTIFRNSVQVLNGWHLSNGLSLYYLDVIYSSTIYENGAPPSALPPRRTQMCGVGGFGKNFDAYFRKTIEIVPLSYNMYISERNIWVDFSNGDPGYVYISSISGRSMPESIGRVIGDVPSSPVRYLPNPSIGIVAPRSPHLEDKTISTTDLEAILSQSDSFEFSVRAANQ